MKNYWFKIAIVLFFMASCGNKVTDFSQLQDRNGLFFLINADKPFSGKVISKKQGIIEFEGTFKNGLRQKQWIFYHPNGQKLTEGLYVDGAKDGQWPIWKENGELDYYEIYKYGNLLTNNQGEENTSQSEKENTSEKDEVDKSDKKSETKKEETEEKSSSKFVDWEQLRGGSRKTLNGTPYTGGFIQYFPNRTKKTVGYYTNGYRSGKWTYYNKNGTVRDVRYY